MNRKLLSIIILVLIVSTISFSRSFLGLIGAIPWHYGYSDVFNEDRVNPALAQEIPYLERPTEYPLVTGFFIYFMWFLGKSLFGYVILTWIFLALSAVATALALYKLTELLSIDHKIDHKRIFWFFIFAPSLLFFGVYNWDIIAVMFMVVAIHFFYKNKYIWAGIFLSIGFNAKLFPILLLPIMLLKVNFKKGIKILLAVAVTFFVLNIYFMLHSFDLWKVTYLFHSSREPNIDSIWSLTGLETNTVNLLSMCLFLLSYATLFFYHKRYGFISLGFISLLLFLSFNKIFSPQYMLWLLPFFVLSQNITKRAFYSLEAANLMVFFSTLYLVFASKELIFLIMSNLFVVARSLILAFVAYSVLTLQYRKLTKQM